MVIDAVVRFCHFATPSYSDDDPFFYLMTFYLLAFAVLLVLAEFGVMAVLVYCEFLRSRPGKALYLILLGLLLFNT